MLKVIGVLIVSSMLSLISTSSFAAYVCYTERFDKRTYDRVSAQYEGCQISRKPCERQGLRHFGYYDSHHATKKAYKRCVYSKPRFID